MSGTFRHRQPYRLLLQTVDFFVSFWDFFCKILLKYLDNTLTIVYTILAGTVVSVKMPSSSRAGNAYAPSLSGASIDLHGFSFFGKLYRHMAGSI
jgi:hypothetical protein